MHFSFFRLNTNEIVDRDEVMDVFSQNKILLHLISRRVLFIQKCYLEMLE